VLRRNGEGPQISGTGSAQTEWWAFARDEGSQVGLLRRGPLVERGISEAGEWRGGNKTK
jgi:hypothetical protein